MSYDFQLITESTVTSVPMRKPCMKYLCRVENVHACKRRVNWLSLSYKIRLWMVGLSIKTKSLHTFNCNLHAGESYWFICYSVFTSVG